MGTQLLKKSHSAYHSENSLCLLTACCSVLIHMIRSCEPSLQAVESQLSWSDCVCQVLCFLNSLCGLRHLWRCKGLQNEWKSAVRNAETHTRLVKFLGMLYVRPLRGHCTVPWGGCISLGTV